MKQIQVTKQDASQRFDKYLKRLFPEMGTSFLYKMLRKKNITLNGKKAAGSELLQEGDEIQCFFSDETFDKFSGKTSDTYLSNSDCSNEFKKAYTSLNGIRVIYEDEHILLLDKPAGILSQKAKPQDLSINEWMIGYLLESGSITEEALRHFKPSVCNRLDRNTSGLLICGKTLIGSRELSRMLKDRTLKKYYHTYVHGNLEGEQVLEGYHYKNTKTNQAKVLFTKPTASSVDDYESIITAYRSIEAKKMYSYLEIELITGKTHQIRAHLAAYGHPIVGDLKYGSKANISDKNYPGHQLLHAYRILFPSLDGDLSYLSNKEFICNEPAAFHKFRKSLF